MASIEQLEQALVNADAAGDADAARTFAGEITRMPLGAAGCGDDADPRSAAITQKKFLEGVPILGGFVPQGQCGPECGGAAANRRGSEGATFGDRYRSNLDYERAASAKADAEHPVLSTALQLGGGHGNDGACDRRRACCVWSWWRPHARALGCINAFWRRYWRDGCSGAKRR